MTNIEALTVAADDHGTRRAMITANDTLSVSMTAWAVSYFGTALDEFATYLGAGPSEP